VVLGNRITGYYQVNLADQDVALPGVRPLPLDLLPGRAAARRPLTLPRRQAAGPSRAQDEPRVVKPPLRGHRGRTVAHDVADLAAGFGIDPQALARIVAEESYRP
jgi:hypothetical protein